VFEVNSGLQIKPAFLIKYATVLPTTFDISTTVFIENKVEVGTSYRYKESLGFLAAFFVNDNFRIGYAYDYSLGALSNFNKGSHEIMLLFDIPVAIQKQGKKHRYRIVKYF